MKTSWMARATNGSRLVLRRTRIGRVWWLPALLYLVTAAAAQAQDYTYSINGGTITIMGYTGAGGAVTIPDRIEDLPVTSIGDSAFSHINSLSNVTIPNSVTSIEYWAFAYCDNLATVTIGTNVGSIGSAAFDYCSSLAGVYFHGNAPSVGAELFYGSDNVTVYYLPGTTNWGPTLGDRPTVLLPYTYTTTNGTITITDYTGAGGAETIPGAIDGLPVTGIGYGAFENTTFQNQLTSITIPNSVTTIEYGAFWGCRDLAGITIPGSVTNIGGRVFLGCNSLTAISVDAGSSFYSSTDGVLFDKTQTTLIAYPGGKAGGYTIPASVTSIGYSAFIWCTRLTSVTITNDVTRIGDHAFYNCDGLTNVTMGANVTSIENFAFEGCYYLPRVTIPYSVTNLGLYAFAFCSSLTGAYFQGNAPGDGQSAFNADASATVFRLPGATGWPTVPDAWGARPTALWQPQIIGGDGFGVRTNRFGFNINWASANGMVVVVESCTNLVRGNWSPIQTNILSGDSLYFSDPQWTNYRTRFYRVRSP